MTSNESQINESARYRLYRKTFLAGPMPHIVIGIVLATTIFFGYYVKDFKMDASSDSITLENDKDLKYYDETRQVFGSDDFVFVVLTPREDLFSKTTLDGIQRLVDDLKVSPGIDSVSSILSVPLFHSPDVPLLKLAKDYRTLGQGNADAESARLELGASPLFSNYLVSEDGKKTIIQARFKSNPGFTELMFRRYALRDRNREGSLSPGEKTELKQVEQEYRSAYQKYSVQRDSNIQSIRTVLGKHASLGKFHLGGVPMIVSDMVGFIKHDTFLFGVLVMIFCVFMMAQLMQQFMRAY